MCPGSDSLAAQGGTGLIRLGTRSTREVGGNLGQWLQGEARAPAGWNQHLGEEPVRSEAGRAG